VTSDDDTTIIDAAKRTRSMYMSLCDSRVGLLSDMYTDFENDSDSRHYMKIAEMCLVKKADPAKFVREASEYYIGPGRKPELPIDYVNEALLDRFCEQGGAINPVLPIRRWEMYESRLTDVASRFGEGFDVFNWLLSATGIEAWFRVAWPYGEEQIKKFYGHTAYQEMFSDPRITRLLREVRPTVVEELESEYGKLYGGTE